MCGILAMVGPRDSLHPEAHVQLLRRMRDTMAHRGPDAATDAVIDGWCALGHRRLSVLDLEGSPQPLWSERGDIGCVYNGEIYNFRDLRSRLTALGHEFATQGDGEVIVHAYEQWGDDFPSHLEGMFAFVLVDRARRRILAARDRFGIKPLFWCQAGKQVLLGSELGALLLHPLAPRSASELALAIGGCRMHVPWPLSAIHGIWKLPPGAMLTLASGGEVNITRFAPIVEVQASQTRCVDDLADECTSRLEAAVRRQMVADVPVGAFLSGGIDSTLTVAMIRRVSAGTIHTFSVDAGDGTDALLAAQTAGRLGLKHHTLSLSEVTFEDLRALPELYGEPFAETSALGVRALSRLARAHVTVALSGDGGDEVFGGYQAYRVVAAFARNGALGALPYSAGLRHVARAALGRRAWGRLLRPLLRVASIMGEDPMAAQRDINSMGSVNSTGAMQASEALSVAIGRRALRESVAQPDPFRLAMAADRLEQLPNAMLTKVDVASMSASLEVRVPLLDDTLVRFADTLPTRALSNVRFGKLVLRRVLDRMLPESVAWAPKRGFSLPLSDWMLAPKAAGPLSEFFGDHAQALRKLTGVEAQVAWSAFRDGTETASKGGAARRLLWLATVALWAERFEITNVERGLSYEHALA